MYSLSQLNKFSQDAYFQMKYHKDKMNLHEHDKDPALFYHHRNLYIHYGSNYWDLQRLITIERAKRNPESQKKLLEIQIKKDEAKRISFTDLFKFGV